MAVSIASVGPVLGVDIRLLHEVSGTTIKNKRIIVLLMIFTFPLPFVFRSNYISYGIIMYNTSVGLVIQKQII